MIKKIISLAWISLFSLLFATNLYAQKNFTKGYVVLPSRDTLQGFINDQNWDRNPYLIEFKKQIDSDLQKFTVRQVEGFGVASGDNYHKSIVKVDKTPTRYEKLLNSPKSVIVTDTVFLLELVKGNVSLYHLLDNGDKNHFYIQKNEGPLEELIQRNYLIYNNNQPMVGTYNQYKDQLKYSFLTDCPQQKSLIDKTGYTKAALSSLVEKYNTCLNPEISPGSKVLSKNESKVSLVAGINLTHYKFFANLDFLNKTSFVWQKNPMVGLGYQVVLPRNRRKWSLYNEVAWKRNFAQGQYNIKESSYSGRGTINIKADYIGLSSMLRYSWMNPNWQPFINAGLAGNFAFKLTTHLLAMEQNNSTMQTYDENILEDFRKYEMALVAGGGIKINKMAAELRLERGDGYVNEAKIAARKTMLIILVSYYLN